MQNQTLHNLLAPPLSNWSPCLHCLPHAAGVLLFKSALHHVKLLGSISPNSFPFHSCQQMNQNPKKPKPKIPECLPPSMRQCAMCPWLSLASCLKHTPCPQCSVFKPHWPSWWSSSICQTYSCLRVFRMCWSLCENTLFQMSSHDQTNICLCRLLFTPPTPFP